MNLGRKDCGPPLSPKEGTRAPLWRRFRENGELHQSTALLFVRPSAILYTAVVPATAAYTDMRNSEPSLPVYCGR